MQHLEVSCAVRPIQWPLGIKWLIPKTLYNIVQYTTRQMVQLNDFYGHM